MIDLTQKILSLDTEATLELNNANAVSVETKRETDLRAEQLMEEAQQLFIKEKNSEEKQLVKSVQEDREQANNDLHKKMETFDKDLDLDSLVEHLLMKAKDHICR